MRNSAFAAAAVLTLSAGGACALEVLYYSDHVGALVPTALGLLGETATTANAGDDLAAIIGSQAWDVVIYDSALGFTPNIDAFAAYVQGGGTAILSYWSMDTEPVLAAEFQVTVEASYTSVQAVNQWVPDPIFASPFPVSDPIDGLSDFFSDDGDEFSVLPGGVAVAGFSAAPSADRAGIVIGNDGRTIINGWMFGNWDGADQNTVNLVANQIASVIEAGAPSSEVPLPAAAPLLAAGLGGLLLLRRRRG